MVEAGASLEITKGMLVNGLIRGRCEMRGKSLEKEKIRPETDTNVRGDMGQNPCGNASGRNTGR